VDLLVFHVPSRTKARTALVFAPLLDADWSETKCLKGISSNGLPSSSAAETSDPSEGPGGHYNWDGSEGTVSLT